MPQLSGIKQGCCIEMIDISGGEQRAGRQPRHYYIFKAVSLLIVFFVSHPLFGMNKQRKPTDYKQFFVIFDC